MSEQPGRSVLYRGGSVYAPSAPFAEAVLTIGPAVAWLGSDDAAASHVDAADEVVELDGALVTAAFVDAHAHVTETGLARTGVNLSDSVSVTDALDRVAAAARSAPGSDPVLGHGWDERLWPEIGRTAAVLNKLLVGSFRHVEVRRVRLMADAA